MGKTFRFSRVAYFNLLLPLIIRLIIVQVISGVVWLFVAEGSSLSSYVLYTGMIIVVVWSIYEICFLYSITLLIDDDGVWIYRGVFPWEKGQVGTFWKDISSASFTQGFLSWTFKSYDINIAHRYTKENELFLKNLYHGDEAVKIINELVLKKQRNNERE